MKDETMIYMAVALSESLSMGVLGAFFWSERRCRERERWLRDRCKPSLDAVDDSSAPADEQQRLIPIHRRPFHEALWEDEPELAPSPQLRAFLEGQVPRRDLEPRTSDGVPVLLPTYTGSQSPRQKPTANVAPSAPTEESAHQENDEMLKQQMAVAALATAGLLSACQAPLSKPEYKRNPHPRERYEITVKIAGAPGPFSNARGAMHYWVPDNSCVPETGGPMNPIRHNAKEKIRYPLEQVDATTYRAEVWTDGMVDEDYYGLGMCKWELLATTIILEGKSVKFAPDLWLRDLRAQQPKTLYFSARTYWSTELDGWPDSGDDSPSHFGAEVQDELFSMTLTPRRIAP